MTMVLALMAMTSALRPFFLKKPFLIGDPDRRVRRRAAGPGDAHALLGAHDVAQERETNDNDETMQVGIILRIFLLHRVLNATLRGI